MRKAPIQRTTGNRCSIYSAIDGLDEARTVQDLVKRLKPILSELAYYGINGEAAILESREEWHTQYSGELQREGGAPLAAAQRAPAVPPSLRSIMDGSHYSLSANY